MVSGLSWISNPRLSRGDRRPNDPWCSGVGRDRRKEAARRLESGEWKVESSLMFSLLFFFNLRASTTVLQNGEPKPFLADSTKKQAPAVELKLEPKFGCAQ